MSNRLSPQNKAIKPKLDKTGRNGNWYQRCQIKDVFGSFLCASKCAVVEMTQNLGSAGSSPTGGLISFFNFRYYFKMQLNSGLKC